MLELKNIKKNYLTNDSSVAALDGIDICFRKNEFVAILGPSGCGKTTLLNIVGGLDHASDGDLLIDGISTKEYKDRDWDGYRNSRIGFVFQSYNLIPHISVVENVEMALIVSGESRQERRKKAEAVLARVGLSDQLNKRPNQLSGGQMQRVSIARALVNNPEIILADEPTGALDSTTSLQVMDLLAEVASERLVILVTHNSELADKYATRIIKLLDGKVVGDNHPFALTPTDTLVQTGNEENKQDTKENKLYKEENQQDKEKPKKDKQKSNNKKVRTKMGFLTALSLSLKNLLTKKVRTFMTAFAGSIGIIGIALVLALSSGFSSYIQKMQVDTMSRYPLTISKNGIDIDSMLNMEMDGLGEKFTSEKKIYFRKVMEKMQNMRTSNTITKTYIESVINPIKQNKELSYGVTYGYDLPINIFASATTMGYHAKLDSSVFTQLLDNSDYILGQYDILEGKLPSSKNEAVLFVDQYNYIYDMYGQMFGLDTSVDYEDFDDILNMTFRVITNHDLYARSATNQKVFNSKLIEMSGLSLLNQNSYQEAVGEGHFGFDIKIVGILRANEETTTGFAASAPIGLSGQIMEYLLGLEKNEQTRSAVAKQQLSDATINVFDGISFSAYLESTTTQKPTYQNNLKLLGVDDTPTTINIYPTSFDAKDQIKSKLDAYNDNALTDEEKIIYTDVMQLFVKMLNTVVDGITYVLVAFTAISLVVSSVMIGIITYVSVLERTKEIGILRSIGARKLDISRVFNAETLIVGFCAGALGVGIAYLISIPLNILLYSLVEISGLVALSPIAALSLVAISMVLTLVAGLVPSGLAAKRDPVVALRTE